MHHYRGDGISLRRGRSAQEGSLGTTMMRRMIGRYKGFRCARMVAGGKQEMDDTARFMHGCSLV